MAIDWTPVILGPGVSYNLTGIIEFRIDDDGIVQWQLNVVIGGLNFFGYIVIPPVAIARAPSVHFDYYNRGIYVEQSVVLYVGHSGAPGIGANVIVTAENGFVYQGAIPEPPVMPHTLENVQAGLADALRNIVGLRVYDFPSDRVETPAAVLSLPETPYDVTLGGRSDEWAFPLWVLVAKADDKAAYTEMRGYLEAEGAKSIRAMVEADRTLGGACDTAAVTLARPMFATVAGTEFLAIEFTLEVYT